jgi:hypothetical protein
MHIARKKSVRAHRYFYMQYYNKPLRRRDHVHHTCGRRDCVNIKHLKVVDASAHATQHNTGRLKSHCKWGHPFKPGTTRYDKKGRRICWTCQLRRFAESRKRCRARILKVVFDDE